MNNAKVPEHIKIVTLPAVPAEEEEEAVRGDYRDMLRRWRGLEEREQHR